MKKNISALILAAGKSERMNFPKPLLKFTESKTFIEKIVEEFILFNVKEIVIVTNSIIYNDLIKLKIIKENFNLIKIIVNTKLELGRFYSVKLGISEILKSNTNYTFLHNCDNPFVNQEVLKKLYEFKNKNNYIIPFFENKGGHPILIPTKVLKKLFICDDNSMLNKELSKFSSKNLEINDNNILININNVETYNLFIDSK